MICRDVGWRGVTCRRWPLPRNYQRIHKSVIKEDCVHSLTLRLCLYLRFYSARLHRWSTSSEHECRLYAERAYKQNIQWGIKKTTSVSHIYGHRLEVESPNQLSQCQGGIVYICKLIPHIHGVLFCLCTSSEVKYYMHLRRNKGWISCKLFDSAGFVIS